MAQLGPAVSRAHRTLPGGSLRFMRAGWREYFDIAAVQSAHRVDRLGGRLVVVWYHRTVPAD